MNWIENMKALKKCLTDGSGIEVPGWGCSDCMFAKANVGGELPNPSDPDEGWYDCSLTGEKRVWGEEPTCDGSDWANEIQREVESMEKQHETLEEQHNLLKARVHECAEYLGLGHVEAICEIDFIAGFSKRTYELANEWAALLRGPSWIVWSNEHEAWWGSNRSGYYENVADAGRYTYAEAVEICKSRSECVHPSLPPELIQPSPELRTFLANWSKVA